MSAEENYDSEQRTVYRVVLSQDELRSVSQTIVMLEKEHCVA